MKRIETGQAPAAIGPYSQAIEAGEWLFTAGQIPIDPATGKIVAGEFATQAERVFDNLEAILNAADLAWSDVAKATVYLVHLEDFPRLNEIYARRFGSHRPARSTIGVASLPAGAMLEIDLVARRR
jgi:2-iminobutanoate/2-iminopropanoate deaminase